MLDELYHDVQEKAALKSVKPLLRLAHKQDEQIIIL